MPEGDTLFRTAEGLRPRLDGKRIEAASPSRFAGLGGRTVTAVEAVGKHLLIRLDDGRAVHTHMGMTGSWHVYAPGERWRKPARLARLVLEVPGAVAVCFSAPVVEVRDRRDLTLGHLGPDILAPLFDVGTVIPRARLMPARALGEVLLDQRVCAGIGNIWKCESLWRLQLDPWVRVADIDDATLLRLYLEARTLMLGSAGGRLVRHAVHGRKGRPCPRCNAAISARQQGNPPRLTYFCPRCQSTPAAPDL